MNLSDFNFTIVYYDEEKKFIIVPFYQILKSQECNKKQLNCYKWLYDLDVKKYNQSGIFHYDETTSWLDILKDRTKLIYSILAIESPTVQIKDFDVTGYGIVTHIGNISLAQIDKDNKSADLNCIIGEKKYWNKGITTASCMWLIDYAFHALFLERIWSGTNEKNIAMQCVFEKLGFKRDGEFKRGAYICDYGFTDVYSYGLLRSDWFEQKSNKNNLKENEVNPLADEVKIVPEEIGIDKVIDKIEAIRKLNNKNWMNILRIAMKHGGDEAKKVMKSIRECDNKISELMAKFVEDNKDA
jgi:hypothetical protein